MAGFKSPDFNERTAAARAAKDKALEALRNKPAIDPAIVAERQAARAAREAVEAEKREARKLAIEEAKAAKAAAKAPPPPPEPAPQISLPTAAELKAARDARYAARKARKK
jgi:hypothetical protein